MAEADYDDAVFSVYDGLVDSPAGAEVREEVGHGGGRGGSLEGRRGV